MFITETIRSLGPDVIYTILLAGIWLAITAVYVPGTGLPEVAALISLAIAVAGLLVLPTNIVGVLLLTSALGCFLALVYFRRQWLLILAGAFLQIAGSIFLFRAGWRPSIATIVIVNAATMAYHQIILLPGLRIQDSAKRVDISVLIGAEGEVVTPLDPVGTVRVMGELWSARADQPIEAKRLVRVIGRKGLQLEVVPLSGEPLPVSAEHPEKRNQATTQIDMRLVNLALVVILLAGTLLAVILELTDSLLESLIGPVLLIGIGLYLASRRNGHRLDRERAA
jgi:membrane-bound serine protease (ClpP class)